MADSAVHDEVVPARGPAVRDAVARFAGDSLYRNSSLLMFNSVLVSALGFLYWTVAARLFDTDDVGTTTTVVSAVAYAGLIGTLGLPNTVIRFLARSDDPVRLLATAGALAASAGGAVGLCWWAIPGHLGIPMDGVAPGWAAAPLFAIAVGAASLGAVAEAAIIALRRCGWVVVENGVASILKLVSLPLAVGAGAAGLFGLFVGSLVASGAVSAAVIVRVVGGPAREWVRSVDPAAIREVRTFAAGNHVAALVSMLPGTVVRVVVLARLGASEAAFLAMPLMIVALLKVIPSTASQSLFAEASADASSLGAQTRRALRAIYAVLLPAVAVLLVAAGPLLSVFGADYAAAGATCLRLLALSGIPAGFNYVADTVLNTRGRVRAYVVVNVAGSVSAIVFPVALVGHGLTGVGLGWLLGQLGYAGVAASVLLWCRHVDRRGVSVS